MPLVQVSLISSLGLLTTSNHPRKAKAILTGISGSSVLEACYAGLLRDSEREIREGEGWLEENKK